MNIKDLHLAELALLVLVTISVFAFFKVLSPGGHMFQTYGWMIAIVAPLVIWLLRLLRRRMSSGKSTEKSV